MLPRSGSCAVVRHRKSCASSSGVGCRCRDSQAGRVHAREHVTNRAVLARRVERLEDYEHGMPAVRVEPVLRLAELLGLVVEPLLPVASCPCALSGDVGALRASNVPSNGTSSE